MPLTPGTRLKEFEILDSLATGGMGEVYRARDTKLNLELRIVGMPKGVVASRSVVDEKACSLKRLEYFFWLENRQAGHVGWSATRICSMTGSSVSGLSVGMASPSFWSASR